MASLPRLLNPNEDGRPKSLHAEQTILGAMLVEPLAIVDATMLLRADDFSLESHRQIYSAMITLSEAGHAIDLVTVSEQLNKGKHLDAVGGLAYLSGLTEGLPRRL